MTKLESKVTSLREQLKTQQQQQTHTTKTGAQQEPKSGIPSSRIETLQQALQASQMSVGKLHERIRELENELLSFNLKKDVNLQLQQV